MQTTKKSTEKPKVKEKTKEDSFTPRKTAAAEDKPKKTINVATPRNYLQKTSTVDIYGQKKKVATTTRAPKKVSGTTHTSNVTPMKDLLKSSPSSVSQISTRSQLTTRSHDKKTPATNLLSARSVSDKKPKVSAPKKVFAKISSDSAMKVSASATTKTNKSLPFSNVTVNSPIAKRKLDMGVEKNTKKLESKEVARNLDRGDSKEIDLNRQRSKTRTLDENEVKVLKTDSVDNNSEMLNLSKKLSAKPQAFYVELDDGGEKIKSKSSDEEIYEDDFESYESDFDSYQSENSTHNSKDNTQSETEHDQSDNGESRSDNGESQSDNGESRSEIEQEQSPQTEVSEGSIKEVKEDDMMDSGTYDLRDQRSASKRPAMEYIREDQENERRPTSLTDEGFQDMSSSSAVSSMKPVDVFDRPLFIDFTKAKENKRKRKLNEQLKQRASDLLSIITLHEMSFNLFEMKPIPYDLYMATFGRANYTQIAVQTFDDGITEEVQTDEIETDHKWTQHPIEFSKHDVYLYPNLKTNKNEEDYLNKFTLLINGKSDEETNNKKNLDMDYLENPLRTYFEQKDGVGSCEMLPHESYKTKMETCDYDVARLRKFLKKVEGRIINNLNNDDKNLNDLIKTSKLPFSKGYVSINPKNITGEELSFLKFTKISSLIVSQTKSNLLMTVHQKCISKVVEKCILCLWDVGVARQEPVKVLIAINNVTIGRFRGSTDGIFVAALDDGSIHLWDLSEEPTWRNDVAIGEKATNLVEVSSEQMTQAEKDREWNVKNQDVVAEELPLKNALQACAYTNSGANIASGDVIDCIVGLEFVGEGRALAQEGRKVLGQICSLQSRGIILLWSIIQEKVKSIDIGRAFWSKTKLEKTQMINLLDFIDIPTNNEETEMLVEFNLNSAKRRLLNKKSEKSSLKKDSTRPKSTSSSEFDISRPTSAASMKKVLPVQKKYYQNWESGVVCTDLKVMSLNKTDKFLIAKNCGEVLCCSKHVGAVKVQTFCIATDTSTVTCLAVSQGLPYFLAATDAGTVSLYSMLQSRVLLTLDCRNGPPTELQDRCQSDSKGRFISSALTRSAHVDDSKECKFLTSLLWSDNVTCCVYTLLPGQSRRKPQCTTSLRSDPISGTYFHWLYYLSITSLHWSRTNPCIIQCQLKDGSLVWWDLMRSDIHALAVTARAGRHCAGGEGVMALLTTDGEIQIHKMPSEGKNGHYLDLFQKYVTLL